MHDFGYCRSILGRLDILGYFAFTVKVRKEGLCVFNMVVALKDDSHILKISYPSQILSINSKQFLATTVLKLLGDF